MFTIDSRDLSAHFARREGDLLWAALDEVEDMVFVKDLDGAFVYNNGAHLRFIGKTRAEVTGRTDFDLFPAEAAAGFFANDTRLFETARPIVSLHRATGLAGEAVLDVAVKTVVQGSGDEVLGLIGIVKRLPLGGAASAAESKKQVLAFVERIASRHVAGTQLEALAHSLDDLLRYANE